MWLKTLERLGATTNENWKLQKQGKHDLAFTTAPVQELVQWLTESSNRLHMRKAAGKRSGLRDLQDYDHKATVAGRQR